MKKVLFILVVFFLTNTSFADYYYYIKSTGSSSNSGTSWDYPWSPTSINWNTIASICSTDHGGRVYIIFDGGTSGITYYLTTAFNIGSGDSDTRLNHLFRSRCPLSTYAIS